MGGPKTTTQKSVTATDMTAGPTKEAAPYFPGLYSQGAGAVNANQGLPVPQDFVAGADPHQRAALDMIYNVAPGLGAAAPSLTEMAKKISSGYFLDPSNDPTFAGAAHAAITPITQALTQQVLPQIVDRSIRTGGVGGGPSAYGGAGSDIANEKAIQNWSQAAGNITAGMANASRTAGMNLLPQAAGMARAGNELALAPAQAVGAAGTQERTFAQDALQNLIQRYSMNQQAPWAGLQQFGNLLTTGGFKNTTGSTGTTQDTTSPAPDMLTQILQGLTGGAGIAGSLFGAPAGGTSAASGIGSIFGSLGGGGATAAATDAALVDGIMAMIAV